MENTQSQNDLELFDSIFGEMRRTYATLNATVATSASSMLTEKTPTYFF